jgi:protocatechuate 3,4-dioxygenase beta subunit
MIKKLPIILSIILLSAVVEAKDILNKCIPAKPYINNYEPAKFNSTNNLLRKSGVDPLFCGQKILLNIDVVDKNCVPLSDVKIYLWQVGCDKKYPYEPLRPAANKKMFHRAGNSTFLGSGIATTNNLGEVKFLTVYPPAFGPEAEHINIRLEHKDLGVFQTKIFLKNYDLIEDDDYEMIDVRIVTPWENIFRRY